MSESLYAGLTSQTIDVFLGDSSSTTGGGLAGLAYNSAGLTCYSRKGATGSATAITLATQTVGGAWSSGGFVQIDSTNMPGVYRFDVPNAVIDAEGYATVYFRGATNLVPTAIRIDCRALPSDVKKIVADSQSATDFKDFADAGYDPATNKVQGVVLVDTLATYTGNTPQTGDAYARLGAPVGASISADVAAAKADTAAILVDTGTDGVVVASGSKTGYSLAATTGLGNQTADITGSLSGSVGSVTGAVGSVTGNVGGNVAGSVGSVTAAVTLPAIPAAWITADGIAANAIGSSEIADGAITAAKIATNAIDADALAADAVAEIQSGLATAANLATVAGYLDTEVAAIITELAKVPKSDGTATWNATALASLQTEANDAIVANRLDELLAADSDIDGAQPPTVGSVFHELLTKTAGSFTFDQTTDSLEAIRDRGDAAWITGGSGTGTGARTVTITVNNGTTALESAKVRMVKGAENYIGTTNASGVIVFSLDDGTWSVAISLAGHSFTPTTLVVDGTETQTYSMTAYTITPSNPGQVTGYLTIFGIDGEVEAGAEIHLQQLQPISGTGVGYDGAVRTEESGVDGVVEFPNMFNGGRYVLWRGTDTAHKLQFTLSASATDPTALSSFVGSP